MTVSDGADLYMILHNNSTLISVISLTLNVNVSGLPLPDNELGDIGEKLIDTHPVSIIKASTVQSIAVIVFFINLFSFQTVSM